MLILDQFGIIQNLQTSVPYSLNQFLGWDVFCRFLQQDGSSTYYSKFDLADVHGSKIMQKAFSEWQH